MCTVVALIRPGHVWPVMLAANRDERVDRPWVTPGRHWPDRPYIVAGRDELGGGTWLGVNDHGVVAAILNRTGSLGPAPGKRSRGEIPVIALDHASVEAARAALEEMDLAAYRSFNLVFADRAGVTVLCADGDGGARTVRFESGVHMVTASDPDDPASRRVARHLPRFAAATPPDEDDWAAWTSLLADASGPHGSAINVPAHEGFGTVCSTLVALPANPAAPPVMRFAAGPPDQAPFVPISA